MKNIPTTVEDMNTPATKGDIHEFMNTVAKGFEAVFVKFEDMVTKEDAKLFAMKEDIANMATKQDVLALHDKFAPYYKFDELSMRVSTLEDNNA